MRLSYELRTGFVKVQYDMRDVGFKVDPQQVDYHPAAANTELATWEAKKSQAS